MDPEIVFVLGTRPEIIKAFPLIKYAFSKSYSTKIIFSKQHYLKEMSKIFFSEFDITPDIIIDAKTSQEKYIKLVELIKNLENSIIFIIGDTSTVLHTAIGYLYNTRGSCILAHIESGLHSLNPLSTEEKIRSMVERIADIRFAPSELEKEILNKIGIIKRIFCFGNPIYNALEKIKIQPKNKKEDYILVTFHRRTNVENKNILKNFIRLLKYASELYSIKYIIHPTTETFLERFKLLNNLEKIPNLEIISPMGYREFLKLEAEASLILTDSGGVQEEALYFRKITIVLRPSTPRWVAILSGVHFLANPMNFPKLIETFNYIIEHKRSIEKRYREFKNPYYNPKCNHCIVETSINLYNDIVKEKQKFDLSKIDFSSLPKDTFLELFRL